MAKTDTVNPDEMIVVKEDNDIVQAIKNDSSMFIYQSVLVRQIGFEQKRLNAVEKILKELELSYIKPDRANNVLLTNMVKKGQMSKEVYDKFWELMEPHNKEYMDSYVPYRDARNTSFTKLEKAESLYEISKIEEEFMSNIRSIITDRLKSKNHTCPYCSQTQTQLPNLIPREDNLQNTESREDTLQTPESREDNLQTPESNNDHLKED